MCIRLASFPHIFHGQRSASELRSAVTISHWRQLGLFLPDPRACGSTPPRARQWLPMKVPGFSSHSLAGTAIVLRSGKIGCARVGGGSLLRTWWPRMTGWIRPTCLEYSRVSNHPGRSGVASNGTAGRGYIPTRVIIERISVVSRKTCAGRRHDAVTPLSRSSQECRSTVVRCVAAPRSSSNCRKWQVRGGAHNVQPMPVECRYWG